MSKTYRRWTEDERRIVTEHYSTPGIPMVELLKRLPGRSISQIRNFANALGMARHRPARRTREQYLSAKRESMALQRQRDPDGVRARAKRWRQDNIERERAKMRAYQGRRFFWSKSMKLRGPYRATARELASLWRSQHGCCALTGRRMDRTAHLDHIIPRVAGGADSVGNLQWVCADANLAKRAMSQDEFVSLCRDVVKWIGERIALVDAIPVGEAVNP